MCKDLISALPTAESLIDWLDRSKWGKNPVEWVFRGQREEWCISPSAWRDDRYLLNGKWQTPPVNSKGQCQCEFEMVQRFFKLGDVQGLPLPGDSPALRRWLERAKEFDQDETFTKNKSWPPVELHWLIAIAQHYGTPTRFIDWTRKPLIAAWFAVEVAAKMYGQEVEKHNGDSSKVFLDKRFVVWAIRRNSSDLKSLGWEFCSAPRSAVPNLHLQSGVFAFRSVSPEQFDSNKVVTPLCQTIRDAELSEDLEESRDSTIRAASVPWSEAGRLLSLLRDRFVQAATVYAGYDGVAQSVKETRWRS